MKQFNVIPGYFHVSVGDYGSTLFPANHPFASNTGIMTDGDIEEGTIVVALLLVNWGVCLGISWSCQLDTD